ncbi:MAG: hypothetical protein ABL996_03070 [Micropepsaceae bacterium]
MRKRQSFHVLLDLNLDALLTVLRPMRDVGLVPCKFSIRQQRDAISLSADIDHLDDAPALALVGAILRLQHVRAATVETRCLAMDDDHA